MKIVNRSPDAPPTAIPLLQKQVALLANAVNASHILQPSTMNFTSIDDCWEVRARGLKGGLFFLRPFRRIAHCTSEGELTVLRRTRGDVDFNVTWIKYQKGLGDAAHGDFFLGLDFLANYTTRTDTCMRLRLAPLKLQHTDREALYDSFRVASGEDSYRMTYAGFQGTVLFDVLGVMKGQRFSTIDRDHDKYVASCSKLFAAGGWFNSCLKANIFGPYKKSGTVTMCSQGLTKSQGDMCSPLTSVHMFLKQKKNAKGSRRVVFSTIASTSCSAELKLFTAPENGLYRFSVGGAAGGKGQESFQPGGRGARVRAEISLRKGSVIGASAGCPGKLDTYAGSGGDASWVVDRSRGILLIAAGGGGGAGDK